MGVNGRSQRVAAAPLWHARVMLCRSLGLALLLALTSGCGTSAATQIDRAAARWRTLLLERDPTEGTYHGLRRYDAQLADRSPTARRRFLDDAGALQKGLADLDGKELDEGRRLTLQLLRWSLTRPQALDAACQPALWDLDHLYGPQVWLPELPNIQPIDGVARARSLEARYRAIPRLLRQLEANLEAGLARGLSAPRLVAERVLAQVQRLHATPLPWSPFMRALKTLPASFSPAQKARVRRALQSAVRDAVYPALSRFATFLQQRYLPRARTSIGISALAIGARCYRAQIRWRTGSKLTPRAIHDLGLRELTRLHGEMRRLAPQLDPRKTTDAKAASSQPIDLPAFIATLRQRDDQRPRTVDDLLRPTRAALERVRRALPRIVARPPGTPIEVRPMPTHRAKDAPAAYYYAAPRDHSRSAYFYVNTTKLPSRSLYNLEALTFHEALPGHHLQIALAHELPGLPAFRRDLSFTAFTEGWALYAEKLADELGLYSSPAARFGYLNYQSWRAARLVVDTGIHALGWTRQRAITFMTRNTALSVHEAIQEIDRYIAWPGQALAYMLGRITIDRLRRHAEQRLGKRFRLPAFHQELLRHGAIPLDLLEAQLERWLRRVGSIAPARAAAASSF